VPFEYHHLVHHNRSARMKGKRIMCLSLFLCLNLLEPPSQAGSANEEAARKSFERAQTYYKLQEYEKALAAYKEAYLLFHSPALLFNMAQCQRLLGDYQAALRSYELFLAEAPETAYRQEIEERIEGLRALLAQPEAAPVQDPALESKLGELEALVARAQEENRELSRWRFALPGGLALAGAAAGAGALSLHRNSVREGVLSLSTYRQLQALSVGADLAFLGAGLSLFFVVRRSRETSVALSPTPGGAMLSFTCAPQGAAR
jgi:tetratricopeptide (TPR) repeat protein